MRTIRANNRAARRKRAGLQELRDAVGKRTPFCYVEYKHLADVEFWATLYFEETIGNKRAIEEAIQKLQRMEKRPFSTYAKAMAHMTALKLNACEEDADWKSLKPCNIVQGYYTVSGKEVIEQTQDISDERNSVGRDDPSSGQPCQQRRINIPVSQAMGNSAKRAKLEEFKRRAAERRAQASANSWSSGTTTSSSGITAVDAGRTSTVTVSSSCWQELYAFTVL